MKYIKDKRIRAQRHSPKEKKNENNILNLNAAILVCI